MKKKKFFQNQTKSSLRKELLSLSLKALVEWLILEHALDVIKLVTLHESVPV
ncbi:hypothetical protein HanIR_Chr16g0807111 [Helianthus annuus]|nr:hypothetical protein HanIR_Chr16g0807111 [Helianthus annuus]